MPEPNNYMLQQPSGGAVQGFAQGLQINQALQAQQDARRLQQQQQAQQAQMQQDLGLLAANPSVAGINAAMLRYPTIADKFKPALESLTKQQTDSRIGQASDVYASLLGGRVDVAKQLLEEQATAAENSGDKQGAGHARVMAKLLDQGDAGVKTVLSGAGMFLSSAMGPDKFAETYSKLEDTRRAGELQPDLVKKGAADAQAAESNATTAAVKAKYADSQAAADLAKAGWDVEKIKNDIQVSREDNRIKAMNAALARETNDLKRQELALKVDEAKQKRDDLMREKASAVTDAQGTIDNMLSTAQMVLNTDPSVIRRATGPVASKLPTASDEVANFEELVKTLGSQVFLAKVKDMKGLGALSDAEGKKLEAGLQNLSLRQSDARLLSNVKEIQRLMLKSRDGLSAKFGAPGKPSELRPGVAQKTVTVDW